MNEANALEYSLAVEARDSSGRMKQARYITRTKVQTVEFVANRLYVYLVNRGIIRSDTCKIPFLLGRVKREN